MSRKQKIKKKTIFGVDCAICGKTIKVTTNLKMSLKEFTRDLNVLNIYNPITKEEVGGFVCDECFYKLMYGQNIKLKKKSKNKDEK